MSCNYCKIVQAGNVVSYVRVGNGNVLIQSCRKHLKELLGIYNSRYDLLLACKAMLTEIEDNNYARYGIDPGADDESDGAKLGRAAIAKAEKGT